MRTSSRKGEDSGEQEGRRRVAVSDIASDLLALFVGVHMFGNESYGGVGIVGVKFGL